MVTVDRLVLGKMMLATLLHEGLISESEHRDALEELVKINSRREAKKINEINEEQYKNQE